MDEGTGPRLDEALAAALDELRAVVGRLDFAAVERVVAVLRDVPGRLFFSGQGRSGFVAQMAAMRFMHLGYAAHAVGEATAPAIRAGDTLVIISDSGRTPVSVGFAEIARGEGATVVVVTGNAASPLGRLADQVVVVAAPTAQFHGTVFTQAVLLLFDSVVWVLAAREPDPDTLMQRNHTNLQ
jgi:6-phospho-3-hexuloisomerase